jgi:hypothetical protein
MAKTKTSAHWSSIMSNTPLPEPWDYCYEWDGPFGTRKFSTASHNGSRPDRSVPIYTPDQMHTHAAAVTAAKDARIKVLEDALWAADLAFAEHGILAVHATRMQVRAALGDKNG